MEKVEALEQELKSVKDVLEHAQSEKLAIDQVCLNNIKENIQLRTKLIMQNSLVDKLTQDSINFQSTIKSLEEKLGTLDAQVA